MRNRSERPGTSRGETKRSFRVLRVWQCFKPMSSIGVVGGIVWMRLGCRERLVIGGVLACWYVDKHRRWQRRRRECNSLASIHGACRKPPRMLGASVWCCTGPLRGERVPTTLVCNGMLREMLCAVKCGHSDRQLGPRHCQGRCT